MQFKARGGNVLIRKVGNICRTVKGLLLDYGFGSMTCIAIYYFRFSTIKCGDMQQPSTLSHQKPSALIEFWTILENHQLGSISSDWRSPLYWRRNSLPNNDHYCCTSMKAVASRRALCHHSSAGGEINEWVIFELEFLVGVIGCQARQIRAHGTVNITYLV